jgi:hypothetical protein
MGSLDVSGGAAGAAAVGVAGRPDKRYGTLTWVTRIQIPVWYV